MTNPADVLTDEFIDRVSVRTMDKILATPNASYDEAHRARRAISAALEDERTPLQTVIFDVRAAGFEAAIQKLHRIAAEGGYWEARDDIRIRNGGKG